MSCDEATGAAAAQTPVVVNIKDECAYSEFYGNKNQYRAGATSACCIMGLEFFQASSWPYDISTREIDIVGMINTTTAVGSAYTLSDHVDLEKARNGIARYGDKMELLDERQFMADNLFSHFRELNREIQRQVYSVLLTKGGESIVLTVHLPTQSVALFDSHTPRGSSVRLFQGATSLFSMAVYLEKDRFPSVGLLDDTYSEYELLHLNSISASTFVSAEIRDPAAPVPVTRIGDVQLQIKEFSHRIVSG